MAKTLTLKRRMDGLWHDAAVLLNAIEALATGKSFAKAAMWLGLAGRIQLGIESHTVPDPERSENGRVIKTVEEFAVDLSNQEARVLGKELIKLSVESFGRNNMTGQPTAPPVGQLYLAMRDWAHELGFKLPDAEEDRLDDLDDDEDNRDG